MAKLTAFGTVLNMGAGNVQIETATVLGTITAIGAGNAEVVVTAAGLSGGADTLAVPVANDDTATLVAGKIRVFIANDATAADIFALFAVSGTGANVVLTRRIPMLQDADLNIAIHDGSCDGLTTADTSTGTHVGETLAAVAYIQSIGGPGLSLDTEDVTTHDSTGAWEEVVGTILRSGEVSLDIVYDPNANSHDATDNGLAEMLVNADPVGFTIVFPGAVTWSFAASVTGFEPSAPHDGALTASVTLKLTGKPILA